MQASPGHRSPPPKTSAAGPDYRQAPQPATPSHAAGQRRIYPLFRALARTRTHQRPLRPRMLALAAPMTVSATPPTPTAGLDPQPPCPRWDPDPRARGLRAARESRRCRRQTPTPATGPRAAGSAPAPAGPAPPAVREGSDRETTQRKHAVVEQLQAARRRHGWTFAELATASGVAAEAVEAIASGKAEASRNTLELLARAVGVPAAELDVDEQP